MQSSKKKKLALPQPYLFSLQKITLLLISVSVHWIIAPEHARTFMTNGQRLT